MNDLVDSLTLGVETADGVTEYTIPLTFEDLTTAEMEAAALLAGPSEFVDDEGNETVGPKAAIAMLFVLLYRQVPHLTEDDFAVFQEQLLPVFEEGVKAYD